MTTRNSNTKAPSRKFGNRSYSANRINALTSTTETYLQKLARSRRDRIVTADDVHMALNNSGVGRNETEARLSIIERVLRTPRFRQTGETVASSRPRAKYRKINQWVFVK